MRLIGLVGRLLYLASMHSGKDYASSATLKDRMS